MKPFSGWSNWKSFAALMVAFALAFCFLFTSVASAQTTIGSGSISGLVTDPSGAAVPGAKVTITNTETGQVANLQTTSTGTYSSGALSPGNYMVRVSATGFKTTQTPVTVQVGVTSTGNVKLQVGVSSTVVEVSGQAVAVNTEQATIQGVLTSQQIKNLPINGRNFLDLAQLEPGVQIQDGSNFDPTKVGFSSISFGGQFGRTARIEVDGVDVSDETVGTTTEDIPSIAISEFQTEQSTLDPSTELTSSGAVNVVTKSGTNGFHGDADGLFRGNQIAAALPSPVGFPTTFQRNFFDGDFGGPIVKNKLFFYASGERIIQHENAGVPQAAPFTSIAGYAPLPFKEGDTTDKLDWTGPHGMHLFYRFSYFKNLVNSAFGAVSYQIYQNEDITRDHDIGLDFSTGAFTHSFRFSYLKFQNNIEDAVRGSNLPYANYPVSMNLGNFFTGPNLLAPQETPQSDRQVKYDGSWIHGNHIIRYGMDYNRIQGGGYAKFFGIDPSVFGLLQGSDYGAALANCPSSPTENVPGIGLAPTDPTCYPADEVIIGNGQGFSTEKPAFGFPSGGLGPDNRLGLYIGDNWKVAPTFTLTAGLRYDRDTGRTDSDINTATDCNTATPPLCFGSAVNAVLPGLGNSVQPANKNFGPQLGFAWDVGGHGTTVIRGGAGVFYENVIYNNVLFDRPLRLATGQFLQFPVACFFGTAFPVSFGPGGPNGGQTLTIDQFFNNTSGSSICSSSIGAGAADFAAFQTAYQASVNAPGPNPSFLPSLLASGSAIPSGLFAPDYKTPRSYQFNIGIQRQLMRGMVLSVDYVRNIGDHYTLGVDQNHSGDIRYFNLAAAQSAVSATNNSFRCGTGYDLASTDCAIANGASIYNYAGNGLDSPGDLGAQQCNNAYGFSCAFPGINPAAGQFPMLQPIGRSVYNGLQMKLKTQVVKPFRGLNNVNFQIAYALSRFTSCGSTSPTGPGSGDQAFVLTAISNADPCGFSGPEALDRTHQLSFGGYFDLPGGLELGTVAHFDSPLPNSLVVPSGQTGAIFQTDFTGDGTPNGQLVPGTHIGEFDRGISAGQLNNVINNYNLTVANQPTPAGQVLIQNGLFTAQQLQQLGGVAPPLPLAPLGQANMSWLRTFDMSLSWNRKVHIAGDTYLSIKPSMSIYNLFNFANFDPTVSPMSGLLTGSPCQINGTVRQPDNCPSDRVGLGTGVYALGAPRTLEFGLGLSF